MRTWVCTLHLYPFFFSCLVCRFFKKKSSYKVSSDAYLHCYIQKKTLADGVRAASRTQNGRGSNFRAELLSVPPQPSTSSYAYALHHQHYLSACWWCNTSSAVEVGGSGYETNIVSCTLSIRSIRKIQIDTDLCSRWGLVGTQTRTRSDQKYENRKERAARRAKCVCTSR